MGEEHLDDLSIEEELAKFEQEERARLGLPKEDVPRAQYREQVHDRFTASQRASTTLLVCGLTMAHDLFIKSALRGIGYDVLALDPPDNAALQFGKEYGNRGQCNPTYFTVGNLVKYLHELREKGLSPEQIIDKYVFLTAGACGPCRFGTYVTEYRKALRDSGFDGFRVLLFQQTGGLKQATGEEKGLQMNPAFFLGVLKAIVIGDVLNAQGYRIRPYEVVAGATNAALERCKAMIAAAFEEKRSLIPVLWRCRRELAAVKVDRLRVRPKVGIIGEFWAMTTEGDGNYRLQSFLEKEGAEADVQLVTAWILYMVWQGRWDAKQRADLRGADKSRFGLAGVDVRKRLVTLAVAEKVLRGFFQTVAHALGLRDYHLPDMDELAEVSHAFYDNHLRGGEGHMEVGKLILNVAKSKVNMTLSVKPFGCMPSSSVSDGVQSLIQAMYPQGIFLPIETSGDGAVNVQSRIQMQLFKARQAAQKEVDAALAAAGLTADEARAYLERNPKLAHAFHRSPHRAGCTTADLIHEIAEHRKPLREKARETLAAGLRAALRRLEPEATKPAAPAAAAPKLADVAKVAAKKAAEHPRPAPEPKVDAVVAADAPKMPAGFRKLPMAG